MSTFMDDEAQEKSFKGRPMSYCEEDAYFLGMEEREGLMVWGTVSFLSLGITLLHLFYGAKSFLGLTVLVLMLAVTAFLGFKALRSWEAHLNYERGRKFLS